MSAVLMNTNQFPGLHISLATDLPLFPSASRWSVSPFSPTYRLCKFPSHFRSQVLTNALIMSLSCVDLSAVAIFLSC